MEIKCSLLPCISAGVGDLPFSFGFFFTLVQRSLQLDVYKVETKLAAALVVHWLCMSMDAWVRAQAEAIFF